VQLRGGATHSAKSDHRVDGVRHSRQAF
jgi:hypothetical protein